MGKGQALYVKAKKLIPGGTQLLSKRPEMFLPDRWPAYYNKAKGCEIWDLDGKKYADMSSMGIGTCILGYADSDVNRAVKKVIDNGSMSTLNAPEEVSLAELLIKIHPWAGMVRYARSGGEAMSIAVRIGRAASGKDMVLFCGYHGWHDWYLSANLASDKALDGHLLPGLSPRGVPRHLKGSSHPFAYNDTEGFLKLIHKFKSKIGVIILEPIRSANPEKRFLNTIREVADKIGAVLIIDEITAGFRLNPGGAHLLFHMEPDIAVFAKGISNGFPMAAIIGRRKVMEKAQETFISSTYWTERIGPVAAIETMKKIIDHKVPDHLIRVGRKVREGWVSSARRHGVEINTSGIYPLSVFSFSYKKPLLLKTLFTQMMLEKGFLASTAFYASYAHDDRYVESYLDSVDQIFAFIAKTLKDGNPERYLKGPVCHSGFKRLT